MTSQRAFARTLAVLLCGTYALGCDKQASQPAAPAAEVAAAPPAQAPQPAAAPAADAGNAALAEAKSVMAQRCTLCHGLAGKGDGAAAGGLNPKPANYTDPKWQASVDDDTLRKAIVGGGPAVGKSMMMPANPDLKDKPQVVDELVKLIRAFKK